MSNIAWVANQTPCFAVFWHKTPLVLEATMLRMRLWGKLDSTEGKGAPLP